MILAHLKIIVLLLFIFTMLLIVLSLLQGVQDENTLSFSQRLHIYMFITKTMFQTLYDGKFCSAFYFHSGFCGLALIRLQSTCKSTFVLFSPFF